ncbi:hypothetical protein YASMINEVIRUS_766 [Yasminevirus sp. GU-2018]|uniref:Uncharacterized protein n=1 Tax=Yasminevirus sp. GU-2018 TaxID=2420051 RepID=A0A5K0UA31_9VIRU|nr:hypothetical protein YASMINEVIRUS_766 [Yasminevirus sp. GU-2018]
MSSNQSSNQSQIQSSNGDYDYLVKLLIVGDSGVGKSSLLLRFADNTFTDTFISTIGVDFKIRTMQIDGRVVKIQIWDTAGQERFRTIVSSYYRGAHGIMYVFDVGDRESFNNLTMWQSDVNSYAPGCTSIIVGNKSDTQNRTVTYEEGRQFASERGMEYIETSAKTGSAVDKAFAEIVSQYLAKLPVRATPKTNGLDNGGSRRLPIGQTEDIFSRRGPKCC